MKSRFFTPGSLGLWLLLGTSLALVFLVSLSYSVSAKPQAGVEQVRVAASADDAEESAKGAVDRASSDLELTREDDEQTVGLRFERVAVPQGAHITKAYVQFTVDEEDTSEASLLIHGEASDDPLSFGSEAYDLSSRPTTDAAVAWSPAAWPEPGQTAAEPQTPDLSPIVQEIVDRADWRQNNALALFITGEGKRVAASYDKDHAAAPLLHVEYDNRIAVDTFTATPAAREREVTFSWSVSSSDGGAVSCQLDADGDGTADYTFDTCQTTSSQTHLYPVAGRYQAVLTASGADGALRKAIITVPVTTPDSITVAAAGDIACDPDSPDFNDGRGTDSACAQMRTAAVLVKLNPDLVLALGDNQYKAGVYDAFLASYDPSWGRLKAKTFPIVGNHEGLRSESGQGYCEYFGAVAHCNAEGSQDGAAYYSFDVNNWHFIALNSNCTVAGGCGAGSPQEKWLRADLAANKQPCILAYWHHPRFSSGIHGGNPRYDAFWQALYEYGADIVLNGHEHLYERFASQNPAGAKDTKGIREFVVGTGGKEQRLFHDTAPNSDVRHRGTFGVLELSLHPASYDWAFVPEVGQTFQDSGMAVCH